MPRRYVSKPRTQAPLPKEVEPIAPRVYRDRWGVEYEVTWNGQRSDRSLLGDYQTREVSS